jgi:hypothetical protein
MLTPLADGTGASVLRKIIEITEVYYECRRKQASLAQAVK